jgi:hypothetical protein
MVVIEPLNPWTCTSCGGSGSLLLMEDAGPLCMGCADLDHLVFLPAGDAALSRRARKASRVAAVVVRFSRSRKRYERQGILVEEAALERAEAQCLADEEACARRRERDRQRRADQDVAFEARLAEEVVDERWTRATADWGLPFRDWLKAGLTATAGTDNPAVAYDPDHPLLGCTTR